MTPDEARAMGEAAAKCVQIVRMTRQELADYRDAIKESGRAYLPGENEAILRRLREVGA
jgi:predicted nucleotidyltransferase